MRTIQEALMKEKNMNTIIVVDDEAVIALRLQQRLTTMRYDVIGLAHSGIRL